MGWAARAAAIGVKRGACLLHLSCNTSSKVCDSSSGLVGYDLTAHLQSCIVFEMTFEIAFRGLAGSCHELVESLQKGQVGFATLLAP